MITGVVLARNEESNIVDCLRALRAHVEELLLIDMESSDRTVELATPLVTKVLKHSLVSNFDAARNIAIPEATHEWLWFIDADERVPQRTGQLVRDLVRDRGHEFESIVIPFKTYFCGKWIQHSGWWPGYTMPRVLKRGCFRFADRLHGGVDVDGRQVSLPADPATAIEHFSYRSIEHYVEKFNRYTSVESQQLAQNGASWDWRSATRHMVHDVWQYYERNDGKLDGSHGWILAWLAGQYRWFTHAKLIDRDGNSGMGANGHAPPADFGQVLEVMQQELARLRGRRPKVPLGIIWRSPIWDPSGYADDGRALAKALSQGPREIKLEPINWSDRQCDLTPTDTALLRALTRSRRPESSAAIVNCIPSLCEPDPAADLNIIRTTFETDRIPAAWLPRLAAFDEVWVMSEFNRTAFRRSGVPPEKLRVVGGCIDTALFRPDGEQYQSPLELSGKFVFLSVFDWQFRKGWDVLLLAYCRAFSPDDGVGLLIKVSRSHQQPMDLIRQQASEIVAECGHALSDRPDIIFWEETLNSAEMAALYRAADAFVLPSRGEGWGRPYMEAMACGIPTIGTAASGNVDFMTAQNSYLIPAEIIDVPAEAADEIQVYRGHRWFEPDVDTLERILRDVVDDSATRSEKVQQSLADIRAGFDLAAGGARFEEALAAAEQRLVVSLPPERAADSIHVELEGEFFASHSFSNINERLAAGFIEDPRLSVSLKRVRNNPTYDDQAHSRHLLAPYLDRTLETSPQVTIRHAFPPNWEPPTTGSWVHIQPWEYGHLPKAWLAPLRERVDEIWVPSQYVCEVYVRSGIPEDKIQVISWGIDPEVFSPDAPPLILPTKRTHKFLFVGGTIARKGFDTLLAAYLEEFTATDDVCLVVKDLGSDTFYRHGNFREDVLAARDDPKTPEIVYLDSEMTPGQMASLYTACDCLAAPYRGEGFGLPILEAMACGLPPIVPRGGPSDDFVTEDTGYLLPSEVVETEHSWELCGTAQELSVSKAELRQALRASHADRRQSENKGKRASIAVHQEFTWARTIDRMTHRLTSLVGRQHSNSDGFVSVSEHQSPQSSRIKLCVAAGQDERKLAECLCSVRPCVSSVVVWGADTEEAPWASIAKEYGATVHSGASPPTNGESSDYDWRVELASPHVFTEDVVDGLLEFLDDVSPEMSSAEKVVTTANQEQLALKFHRGCHTEEAIDDSESRRASSGSIPSARPQVRTRAIDSEGEIPDSLHVAFERFGQGDFFHAECYLRDSLSGCQLPDPWRRKSIDRLIASYRAMGEPHRAAEACDLALQDHPDDPQLQSLVASIHADIRQFPDVRNAHDHSTSDEAIATADQRLYLGAGDKRLSGHTHVDVVASPGIDVVWDLNERPWPWESDSIERIIAEDVVEHLRINLVEFCDEAWHVLSPSGELFVRTPHYKGESSWIDPTHYWHLDSRCFEYLDPTTEWGRLYPNYTDKKWRILSLGVRGPQNIHALLRPLK